MDPTIMHNGPFKSWQKGARLLLSAILDYRYDKQLFGDKIQQEMCSTQKPTKPQNISPCWEPKFYRLLTSCIPAAYKLDNSYYNLQDIPEDLKHITERR